MYWYVIYQADPAPFTHEGKRHLLPVLGITRSLGSEETAYRKSEELEEKYRIISIRSSEGSDPNIALREYKEEKSRLGSMWEEGDRFERDWGD